MQNDFNDAYVKLLYEQVNAEIDFLLNNGHDQIPITKPCMFCYKDRDSRYGCNRLKHLGEFKSQIDHHYVSRSRATLARRPIGKESIPHEPSEPFEALTKEVEIFKLKF